MKFTILIDQRTIAERFPTMTLKDAALAAFLGDMFNSPRLDRHPDPEGGLPWTWAKYGWIRRMMPLLEYGSDKTLGRAMQTLRELELIETRQFEGTKTCHRPGPRWPELMGDESEIEPPEAPRTVRNFADPTPKTVRKFAERRSANLRTLSGHTNIQDKTEGISLKNPPLPPEGDFFSDALKSNPNAPTEYPPEWQASAEFIKAFGDYLTVRKQKRQAITPAGRKLLAAKLTRYSLGIATEALTRSAENGWTGVFPEAIAPAAGKPNSTNESTLDLF